jgi:DNA-binding CsgD family transcriptional regulator
MKVITSKTEALQEKIKMYEDILDNIEGGIYVNYPEGTLWSNKYCHIKGYSPEEIEAYGRVKFQQDFYHPDDAWIFEESYKYLLDPSRGKAISIYRQKGRTGEWFTFLVSGAVSQFTLEKDIGEAVICSIPINKKYLGLNRLDNLIKENLKLKNELRLKNLSKREQQVLSEFAAGLSTKQVAEKLNVSFHTVESHRKRLFEKLNMHSTAELVRFATECGF